MIAMDKAVTQVVGTAIGIFRANLSTYVPDIFENESPTNQDEITTWYGNPANLIKLQVGWPTKVISMPGIWATLGPAQETSAQQLQGYGRLGAPGMHALPLQESVQLIIASPNQNEVLWLQQLVLWALWTQRPTLIAPPYNFQQQMVTASPLAPIPDSAGDVVFPFARAWTLTAWRMTGFSVPVPAAITAVDLTLDITNV